MVFRKRPALVELSGRRNRKLLSGSPLLQNGVQRLVVKHLSATGTRELEPEDEDALEDVVEGHPVEDRSDKDGLEHGEGRELREKNGHG